MTMIMTMRMKMKTKMKVVGGAGDLESGIWDLGTGRAGDHRSDGGISGSSLSTRLTREVVGTI
jgi:hypothetical protein